MAHSAVRFSPTLQVRCHKLDSALRLGKVSTSGTGLAWLQVMGKSEVIGCNFYLKFSTEARCATTRFNWRDSACFFLELGFAEEDVGTPRRRSAHITTI